MTGQNDSRLGLCVLLGAVAVHLFITTFGPANDGFLFRGGVLVEALGQTFLLVAPPFALYAGVRAAFRDRDDPLAYLAASGGAFLTLLTGVGLGMWLAR